GELQQRRTVPPRTIRDAGEREILRSRVRARRARYRAAARSTRAAPPCSRKALAVARHARDGLEFHFVLWEQTYKFPAKSQRRKEFTLRLCAFAGKFLTLALVGRRFFLSFLTAAALLLFRGRSFGSFLRRFSSL